MLSRITLGLPLRGSNAVLPLRGSNAVLALRGSNATLAIRGGIAVLALLASAGVSAQQPAPPGMSPAEAAAKRFPQPVRVGDLVHRTVLQPLESQPVLGRVAAVVRQGDGRVSVVVNYGGLFGIGARPIAVPVEAMTLAGYAMEIVDFTPRQLSGFPTYSGAGATPIPPDATIEVGLSRPSH